jgi:tryptophan 2,3-dioxygenase
MESIDGLPIARAVMGEVRRVGKHFLPGELLDRLAGARGLDPHLDAFLDCALDKHEHRFHNRTYLALSLVERIGADLGLTADGMATLLVADIVRFEVDAALRGAANRPDDRTLQTRLKHCLRFVTGVDIATPERAGPELIDLLPAPPASPWFAMTVAPVYVLHDEYFFIRALQAHEMVFTVLADDVRAATAAFRAGSFADGIARLDHAIATFRRAALLFRIVATMQPTTFHAFREFTQGASAIQSEQYKRFEIACGRPTPARSASDAFTSVPAVRASAGHDDLSQAYLDGGFTSMQIRALDERIAALENAHQRWKAAHHGIAARMLGDAAGSGYTSGVPYLRACLDNRLFWRLDHAGAAIAA